jgi:hypothetical protein
VPPWKIERARPRAAWANAFLALPDERMAWDPAIAEKLAQHADISVAEATLLFNGAPERDGWGKDFLGKKRREIVGLKMGDADAARTTFKDMDDEKLYAVIATAVPDDVSLLATPLAPGGFAERLGDAWKRSSASARGSAEPIALAKKELIRRRAEQLPACGRRRCLVLS